MISTSPYQHPSHNQGFLVLSNFRSPIITYGVDLALGRFVLSLFTRVSVMQYPLVTASSLLPLYYPNPIGVNHDALMCEMFQLIFFQRSQIEMNDYKSGVVGSRGSHPQFAFSAFNLYFLLMSSNSSTEPPSLNNSENCDNDNINQDTTISYTSQPPNPHFLGGSRNMPLQSKVEIIVEKFGGSNVLSPTNVINPSSSKEPVTISDKWI
ncbi:LOW QUALITY PROTEIN: hypothetical protein Cgig2_000222 [Carnegiea gigantea]|uniref:Uncharacterized protein n=1 Tax=Carnegiea gigantea TaxID=171969 RepID=A0A9Q1Q4C1_9CARY|nr:LOW QUALITY PROTEIN: hypothetical protein Cgig2_000222 [Carnegiea gigantea]